MCDVPPKGLFMCNEKNVCANQKDAPNKCPEQMASLEILQGFDGKFVFASTKDGASDLAMSKTCGVDCAEKAGVGGQYITHYDATWRRNLVLRWLFCYRIPAPTGAVGKPRLESSIHILKPHCMYVGGSTGQTCIAVKGKAGQAMQ